MRKSLMLGAILGVLCLLQAAAVDLTCGAAIAGNNPDSLTLNGTVYDMIAKVDPPPGSSDGLTVESLGGTSWQWMYNGDADIFAVAIKPGNQYAICVNGDPEGAVSAIEKGVWHQFDLLDAEFGFDLNPQGIPAELSHLSVYGAPSVPEPSTIAASLASLLLLGAARRRFLS
jgi:hypothetical protein